MKKNYFLAALFFTFITFQIGAQENPIPQQYPLDRADVNAFDRMLMNPYSAKLDKVGDAAVIVTMAAPLVLLSTPSDQWLTECVMYGEACVLAYGMKVVGKACVDRARPYMYFNDYPLDQVADGDYLCSWPSAHSTMAFTSAAFTSYVYSKYFPDSPLRYVVTAGSYAAATAVAAMRIASGNHFMTDVLTGAAFGTVAGFIVPYVHTLIAKKMPASDGNVQVQASPFSLAISFNF